MKLLEEEIFKTKTTMNIPIKKNTILESNAIFGGTEVDVNNFEVGKYYYGYSNLFHIIKILEIKGDSLTYLQLSFDEDAVKFSNEPEQYTYPKWIVDDADTPNSPPNKTFWETSEKFWNYVSSFPHYKDANWIDECQKCVPAADIKVGKYYIYRDESYDEIVKIKKIENGEVTVDYIEYTVLVRYGEPEEFIYNIEEFDNNVDLSSEKNWERIMSLPILDDVKKGSGFGFKEEKEKKKEEVIKKEEKRKNKKKQENNKIKKEGDFLGCKSDKSNGSNFGDVTVIPQSGYAIFKGKINNYEVTVDGCFDDGKVIMTFNEGEKGQRGNFKGYYYTKDTTEPLTFDGDENFANNFYYGVLVNNNEIDIKEYENNFHTKVWTYSGYFTKEGKIGESNPEIKLGDDKPTTPIIKFALGDYYQGEFKDSKINGNGLYYFAKSGIKISGVFSTIENEDGGSTYSVITNKGRRIDDIFEFEQKYSMESEKDKEDQSLGILKKGRLNGTTFFKTLIKNKKTEEKKELSNFLPYVKIRLVNKRYKNIKFETMSDSKGNFIIENLPFGIYKIYAVYLPKNEVLYRVPNENIFKKKEFTFNSEGQKISIPLIPTKNTIRRDNKRATEEPNFLKNITPENYLEKSLKLEKSKFKYNKFLKKSDTFDFDYTDKETLNFCKSEMSLYAKMMKDLYDGTISKDMVKTPENLKPTKDFLKKCYKRFKGESKYFDYTKNEDLKLIINPGSDLYDFKIVLENKYIYRKNNVMNITDSIRKVITEHNKIKSDLNIEKNIIENRLNFILETSNLNKFKINLIMESKKLISVGYNKKFVDSFVKKILN